jgi:hypothetical protein
MLVNHIPDPGNIYLLVCLAGFLTYSVFERPSHFQLAVNS